MNDSILTSIKKLLGIPEEQTHFDPDIIVHINTVLGIVNQLGAGADGFTISDKNALWSEFIPDDSKLEMIKTYVYQKVKLMFDPPLNSAVTGSLDRSIAELEWRINSEVDYKT